MCSRSERGLLHIASGDLFSVGVYIFRQEHALDSRLSRAQNQNSKDKIIIVLELILASTFLHEGNNLKAEPQVKDSRNIAAASSLPLCRRGHRCSYGTQDASVWPRQCHKQPGLTGEASDSWGLMRRLGRLRQARRRPLLESLRFFCCHLRGNAPGPGTLPPEHVFRIQHIRHLCIAISLA